RTLVPEIFSYYALACTLYRPLRFPHSSPTRRSSDLLCHPSTERGAWNLSNYPNTSHPECPFSGTPNGKERLMTNHFSGDIPATRSEEHTSELHSRFDLV